MERVASFRSWSSQLFTPWTTRWTTPRTVRRSDWVFVSRKQNFSIGAHALGLALR